MKAKYVFPPLLICNLKRKKVKNELFTSKKSLDYKKDYQEKIKWEKELKKLRVTSLTKVLGLLLV
jgi:hypothetical protein